MKRRRFEEALTQSSKERLKQSFKTTDYLSTLIMTINCSSLRKKEKEKTE